MSIIEHIRWCPYMYIAGKVSKVYSLVGDYHNPPPILSAMENELRATLRSPQFEESLRVGNDTPSAGREYIDEYWQNKNITVPPLLIIQQASLFQTGQSAQYSLRAHFEQK